jgi:2-amino-4-hydroxy-6-hydroxymethyldihydropteridine diphosphokinase
MTQVLIALGANLPVAGGNIAETLEQALESLRGSAGIAVTARSRWYRAPAFPPGSGPDFVNGAAALETGLAPESLLAALHRVEAELGRARPARWAPRVCDLDLIAIEDTVLPDRETLERWMAVDLGKAQTVAPAHLILPHPRMHERGFVLAPLAEIAPDWRHPVTGRTVAEMLAALPARDLAGISPIG